MNFVKKFVINNWFILLIFFAVIFLRFYRLEGFVTFLSDQGRDAIIIKNIVTFSHLPAIGAASSVGQVYLGPFYYYLIAPFLPLFNFNPVGLAFGVAFFSIVGMIALYFIVKREIDAKTALLFLVLIGFSSVNIEASRFSWNPNLLPFFSFLTLYLFHQFLKTKKIFFALLFGAFFSFCLQLHYLAAFLIIPMLIFYVKEFLVTKNKPTFLVKLFAAIASFLLFMSPLLIFDLRHNFLNTRNLIKLFTQQGILSHTSLLNRIVQTVQSFFSQIMVVNMSPLVPFIVLGCLLIAFLLLQKKQSHLLLNIHLVNTFSYLIGFALLNSPRHPHYYHPVYFSFFLIVAYLFSFLIKKLRINLNLFIVTFFFVTYIIVNVKNCYFLFDQPGNQIQYASNVANFLADKIDHKPFNIATWPVEFFEDQFVYFLELKGLVPADRTKVEITNQMFVLCNQEPCKVLNSPSWNISMFGKAKIDTIWEFEGLKIYKLVHES